MQGVGIYRGCVGMRGVGRDVGGCIRTPESLSVSKLNHVARSELPACRTCTGGGW
jgi:hypothetical protein